MLDNSEDKPAVTVGMNDTGITGVEPDDGCRVLPRPEPCCIVQAVSVSIAVLGSLLEDTEYAKVTDPVNA